MKTYLDERNYQLAVEGFHGFCGMLLFEFADHTCDTKDVIIRNFVARTDTMVRGVMRLWSISDFQDCWILYRCLLDRLFHLVHLGNNDQFQLSDDWSFVQQYNSRNRLMSDPQFNQELDPRFFMSTTEEKARYSQLSSNPPKWERPKPEDVAKTMKQKFLYKYGYDFGSTHVHPMANDGQQDFFTITNLEPTPDFADQRAVISNSILVGCLIVLEGLNMSNFKWRRIVYDFLNQLVTHLDTGSLEYRRTLKKLSSAWPEFVLSQAGD